MNNSGNLPTPVKVGGGAAGLVAVAGAGWFLRDGGWIFFAVLLVLLLLLLIGWLSWRAWSRRKKNKQLSGQLSQHSSAAPKGISDPAKRAQLDALRQRFQQGITEYRSRGKDLYKLPWYVICGPPGAGKTEAIRHCNVGFPPGMQDSLQGVGGTINMNWWFTNHAVILDTAGKLLFEEVTPGETSEWREFLSLLKKTRPNCPINGLFLAISVEDLIKDSADKILQKAGRIAQQLDVIQRVLDVRFPVYVIVTKCDLLIGFREFFDGIADPQLQHQIVGWSNPEPLDTAFRPELIDQHLTSVSNRLRKRRLGLLRDPVPESSDHRRTDEVDALFALPNSLTLIGPRLRRYLETIFVAGEWSAKPLFLRGIYFTSSMREGSALDQELAQAVGVPVSELAEAKAWERERAFFLRDLFMEKVFKERGLVTRATNTARMLLRRRATIFGTAFGALALFIAFCVFGNISLKKAISDETKYWQYAAENKQRLSITQGATDRLKDFNPPSTIPQFHALVKTKVQEPIRYGVFRPIAWMSTVDDASRKTAQYALFEQSVVTPIFNSARSRIANSTNIDVAGLKALVDLEVAAGKTNVPFTRTTASDFLALGEIPDPKANESLTTSMEWIYSKGAGRNKWPPTNFTGGADLSKNLPIRTGVERFLEMVKMRAAASSQGLTNLQSLWIEFTHFSKAESNLIARMNTVLLPGEDSREWDGYDSALKAWSRQVDIARRPGGVLQQTPSSAVAAYDLIVATNTESLGKIIKKFNDDIAANAKDGNIAEQIKRKTENELADILRGLEGESQKNRPRWQAIDQWCLTAIGTQSVYEARLALYRAVHTNAPADAKIGSRWQRFTEWDEYARNIRKDLAAKQMTDAKFESAITNYLARTTEDVARKMLRSYQSSARQQLEDDGSLGFPIIRDESAKVLRRDQIAQAKKSLDAVLGDFIINPPKSTPLDWADKKSVNGFSNALFTLSGICTALGPSNGRSVVCTLTLLPGEENWVGQGLLRYVKLDEASKREQAYPKKSFELGKKSLEDPVGLTLYGSNVEDEPKLPFKDERTWPILRMFFESASIPQSPSRQFTKDLGNLEYGGVRRRLGNLNLRLDFDPPLPPPETWPNKNIVENLSLQFQ